MFRIIIFYELAFIIFWNVLYFANGNVSSWITNQFLSALFIFLTTMSLGFTLIYIIYISARFSGFIHKIKNIKDPRTN